MRKVLTTTPLAALIGAAALLASVVAAPHGYISRATSFTQPRSAGASALPGTTQPRSAQEVFDHMKAVVEGKGSYRVQSYDKTDVPGSRRDVIRATDDVSLLHNRAHGHDTSRVVWLGRQPPVATVTREEYFIIGTREVTRDSGGTVSCGNTVPSYTPTYLWHSYVDNLRRPKGGAFDWVGEGRVRGIAVWHLARSLSGVGFGEQLSIRADFYIAQADSTLVRETWTATNAVHPNARRVSRADYSSYGEAVQAKIPASWRLPTSCR